MPSSINFLEKCVAWINALIGYEVLHVEGAPVVNGQTMLRRRDLRYYQVYIAKQCVKRKVILLAVDMGLGKTASVLTALSMLFEMMEIRRALIIGPKLVCTDTWPDEINRWEHLRHLTYSVIVGTPAEREKAAREDTQLHILNKENIPWFWEFLRDGADWDYDILIIDEASMLKAGKKRTSSRTKKEGSGRGLSRFGVLARARHKVDRVIEMTGTPAPEGLHNLWGLAYILDLGKRLGTARTAFERRWFDSDYMGWSLEPKPNAEKDIMGRLEDVMIGLRAEDYLELPPVVTTPHTDKFVVMPPKMLKEYKRFERTLVSEEYDVEAITRGVLINKLCQFANGSMYDSDRNIVHVHDLKLNMLSDMVEEFQGARILVAYRFRFDLDRIRKKFPHAVVFSESKTAIKDWNSGKIQMGLVHPANIGHGTNLQFGGNILIWYGLQHSAELYQQLSSRLPRPGQKHKKVYIYHILTKDTADEHVLASQLRKRATEKSVFDYVRIKLKSDTN